MKELLSEELGRGIGFGDLGTVAPLFLLTWRVSPPHLVER